MIINSATPGFLVLRTCVRSMTDEDSLLDEDSVIDDEYTVYMPTLRGDKAGKRMEPFLYSKE